VGRESVAVARLTPWEGAPPSEAALRDAFRAEGLSPYAWSNGPGDRYGVHTHSYDKVLYCARGGITFQVEGADVSMRQGDRLDLPAGTAHAALVGPEGCTCLEAHR
jgi:quercetin dioxygenase-like cupin family protein